MTILVSTGKPKVTVPDVRNKTLNDAISPLNDVHLTVERPRCPLADGAGRVVVGQSPAGGERCSRHEGAAQRLAGPNPVPIPNVVGEPFANAAERARGRRLHVVRKDTPSSQPKGEVVTTTPGRLERREGSDGDRDGLEGPAPRRSPT